jgi:hypothetical protein
MKLAFFLSQVAFVCLCKINLRQTAEVLGLIDEVKTECLIRRPYPSVCVLISVV